MTFQGEGGAQSLERAGIPISSGAVEQDTLMTVLGEIEAGLDTIQHLEHEAKSRSQRLRAMIRELKVMSGVEVTMTEQEQHGGADVPPGGDESAIAGH